ncbi:MAG: hypothetical protein GSR79_07540 [Desulfurococcales archaeon]|nr:hypothetical protein [Desulfurococcales archaeon]
MDKQAKSRLLGVTLLFIGFILMTLYPYSIYFMGEKMSCQVIKATLTVVIVLLSLVMISVGVNIYRRE